MEFAYDGGGMGKGGDVTLYCDGKEVGKGRVDQTQGFIFSADETTDSATNPVPPSVLTTPPTRASSTARSTGFASTWATTPRTPTTTSSPTNASGSQWRAVVRFATCPDDVLEQGLAKCEFPWIVVQVEAGPVHRVGEPDTGIGIGEPERASGPRGSERLVRRTEPELGEGFEVAERECRVDVEHFVAQPLGRWNGGLG